MIKFHILELSQLKSIGLKHDNIKKNSILMDNREILVRIESILNSK